MLEPLIVINRSPAPSVIAKPSKIVAVLPAPIIETLEVERVILSSKIDAPHVPSPTLITPPHVGNCEMA